MLSLSVLSGLKRLKHSEKLLEISLTAIIVVISGDFVQEKLLKTFDPEIIIEIVMSALSAHLECKNK